MFEKPIVINDHSKIEDAYRSSLKYLQEHPDLQRTIATHLWAYHEIGDLVPQTIENFWSGHFFPYSESYYELENSYQLALLGFYNYAFVALRSVLELGLLGVYFAVRDTEHLDIRPWITSRERTPRRREIFKRLREIPALQAFDERFGLENRITELFDTLDRFVHTRGYRYSSSALTLSNCNRFSERSLKMYCDSMFAVVTQLIVIMLLKYPVGMQGLPLDEKFGLNGPVGGFLQEHQVQLITSLLSPEEKEFLQRISNEDPNVKAVIEYFNNLPDITEEEWRQQIDEFDTFIKSRSRPNQGAG